jgi:hypothetical protein
MIKPSPALLQDLQEVLKRYGYNMTHAVINSKQGNHRYIFTDKIIKILIELSKYEKNTD